jgi:NADPH2 dehydrogenase
LEKGELAFSMDVWKKVNWSSFHVQIVDGVHSKGSFIYLQLWALGRSARPDELRRENVANAFAAPSAIPLDGTAILPRPMTSAEVKEFTQLYATAASNAVHRAGFDGVEIHGANGYLIDQFLQDMTNDRTDEYGGSVENRSRFALEVTDAVVRAVGANKTGIRLSPWSTFQGHYLHKISCDKC